VSLDLRLHEDRVAPGEVVRGWVGITAPLPGSRSLEAFLRYVERTPDYAEVAWEAGTGPLHLGPLTQGQAFAFGLRLPAEATPGYTSRHGWLFWAVDVKSDEPHGHDTHARVLLDVAVP